MESDGVIFKIGSKAIRFEQNDKIKVTLDNEQIIEVETVLVAVGRVPNIECLDLDKAGVEFD